MPATNTLDFSNAQTADKALKKVSQLMIRSGQPVISTEFIEKPKRTSGVTYREANLTLASGQTVTLRVNSTGDIFQVLLNGSVKPIKSHDDTAKAVSEIAGMAEKNQAAFQKAQARIAVELPKGMNTPAPKMEAVLTERSAQLDTQIADRKATVAELEQRLGIMTDSIPSELTVSTMLLSGAYVAAREIAAAYPAMLDSGAYAGAIQQLRVALDVVETNYPINVEAGNLDQANLEKGLATSFRTAIAMLDSAGVEMTDEGLAELVNIAALAAAEDGEIKDQEALAQLLALGLVETAEGLYMTTSKGKNALDDAGFDIYGEPYAAGED